MICAKPSMMNHCLVPVNTDLLTNCATHVTNSASAHHFCSPSGVNVSARALNPMQGRSLSPPVVIPQVVSGGDKLLPYKSACAFASLYGVVVATMLAGDLTLVQPGHHAAQLFANL